MIKSLILTLIVILSVPIGYTTVAQAQEIDHEPCIDPKYGFVVDGEKSVSVEWCELEHFGNTSIVAHAPSPGNWIHSNREATFPMSQKVLLHELGHTLGYVHDADGNCENCGVMNYSTPDTNYCGLSSVTKDIANSYEGYRVIDWDTRDILYLIKQWADGETDTAHITWAIEKWTKESPCETVYYSSNFNHFGGYYPNNPSRVMGIKVNQHKGYFYGLPVIEERIQNSNITEYIHDHEKSKF